MRDGDFEIFTKQTTYASASAVRPRVLRPPKE